MNVEQQELQFFSPSHKYGGGRLGNFAKEHFPVFYKNKNFILK